MASTGSTQTGPDGLDMGKNRTAPAFGRDLQVRLWPARVFQCDSCRPHMFSASLRHLSRHVNTATLGLYIMSRAYLLVSRVHVWPCFVDATTFLSPCWSGVACLQDVCRCKRVPVYRDCISFLTKTRDSEQAAYCLEGLFKSAVTDRKVQLLRQAYQLGRNPLRMLVGLQDPYAVRVLLVCCSALS